MKKRVIAGTVLAVLMVALMSWGGGKAEAETAETVTYDAAEFESFQGRTKEEVGRRYGEAMYAGEGYINGDPATYYETAYSLENPYAAGELTEDTHKTMTAMTEFYRWLTGVSPLQAVSSHSNKLQAEALVRNFEFNHTISDSSKPEDMTQEFWDYGAKDYIHTILARYSTPRNAITSWMNEGYSYSYGWDTVGHRYALIGGTVSDVQYGYAGSIAIGQEKAYKNSMVNPFSAYPAPGYMPADLVHSRSSAWSIQVDMDRIAVADGSSVVVKVTSTDTGESYECTTANGKLKAGKNRSLIVFAQPVPVSGTRYTGSYRVDVSGLTDVGSGKDAVITYTTEFFDPVDYTPSYVKYVSADGIQKYIIYTSTATTENLKKIAYALPDEGTVSAENGRTAQVPVTGNWILDENEQCWVNQADAAKLPADITDREDVLKKCAIYYEISESVYDSYNSLNIYPSELKAGEAVEMHVYLSLTSADTSAIFQLVPQGDGTYSGRKKYDSRTAAGFEVTSNGDHLYKIPSVQKSDEGEYFSIFYDSSDTRAYVSTRIRALTVKDDPQQTPDVTPGGEGTPSPKPSAAPDINPGGESTPSPKPSVTPDINPGGEDTPSPKPSAAPDINPGETSGDQTGKTENGTSAVGDHKKTTVPPTVKGKKYKIKVKKKGLVLTWKRDLKVSGYQVQISTKKNFKNAKKISIKKSKTKYKFSKLKSGKKYYIRIRAYRSYKTQDGKTRKAYEKWTIKKITIL